MAPVPDRPGSTPDADAAVSEKAAASRRPGRVEPRILVIVFVGAAILWGVDQGIKAAVVANLRLGEVVPLIGELLQLRYVTNSGAAFSLFSGYTWLLTLVALGVILFIVWFARRIHSVAWGVTFALVLGGALGNATDRFVRPPGGGQGHVVDYIQVWGFPAIFNFSDIPVTTAMGMFLLLTLRGIRLDGTRVRPSGKTADPDA